MFPDNICQNIDILVVINVQKNDFGFHSNQKTQEQKHRVNNLHFKYQVCQMKFRHLDTFLQFRLLFHKPHCSRGWFDLFLSNTIICASVITSHCPIVTTCITLLHHFFHPGRCNACQAWMHNWMSASSNSSSSGSSNSSSTSTTESEDARDALFLDHVIHLATYLKQKYPKV